MDHGVRGIMMLLALCLAPAQIALSQAAPDPWYGRNPKSRDIENPKGPLRKVSIEFPRTWQIVPGYGEILVAVAEKTRNNQPAAAIVLEQSQLQAAINPNDITDELAQAEVGVMRARLPGVKTFEHQLKQADGFRFIFIQYSKPGMSGTDRVVQYSIPAGTVMYRLICIAPEAQLTKYQSLFAHVAASFKAS
jgi:hypothetical protein